MICYPSENMVLSAGASSTSHLVEIDNGGSDTVGKVFPCQKKFVRKKFNLNHYWQVNLHDVLLSLNSSCLDDPLCA